MSRLFISALALVASLLPAQEIHTLVSDGDYLAFPAVIELGDEVLVSFKRGKAHAADAGATQELLRLGKASGKVLATGTLAAVKGEIMQMGEWVATMRNRIGRSSRGARASMSSHIKAVRRKRRRSSGWSLTGRKCDECESGEPALFASIPDQFPPSDSV